MKTSVFAVATLAVALTACAETFIEKSPDGKNEIRLNTEPELTYEVWRNGLVRIAATPISMEVEGKASLKGAKVLKSETSKRAGIVKTPIYKKATIDNAANETCVTFDGGWQVRLLARNDGVAYSFATTWADNLVRVTDEKGGVTFPSDDIILYAGFTHGHSSSWESMYDKLPVSKMGDFSKKLCYLPLTVQYPDGVNICVTESDLLDYPGWNMRVAKDKPRAFTSDLAKLPDPMKIKNNQRHRSVGGRLPYLAQTQGTRTYPWRVFITADEPVKMLESDIVYALATPCKLPGDLSWIKPGKVAWEWWNCWNIFGKDVNFKAGCNTETYKYYIDFASETGVEYVIMDEGWSVKLKVMEINPEIDVEELVRYGKKKNVGIILWCSWPQLVDRQDEVFKKYAGIGVKGFKIDFMDRDDQFVVDYLEKTAQAAARYNLLLDYHGMYKPTGFSRTYPNIVNYEGVHGLETAKFDKRFKMPRNDLMVTFTRMVAGPLDYTPGAMRYRARNLGDIGWPRSWSEETAVYEPNWNQPDAQGTRVHQMALMSLYEAPLQMLCDSPSLYRENMECFKFMADVPTVWDETLGLAGNIDKYALVARRNGKNWWVAGIANWDGAELELDTSFLGGGEWIAEIFEDGINAKFAPQDYSRREIKMLAGFKIPVNMAPGGGFTVKFRPVTKLDKMKFWK